MKKYQNSTIAQMYIQLKICKLSRNGYGNLNKDSFYWVFDAQPTPLSKKYRILIIFHKDIYAPRAYIVSNDITKLSQAPHLYDSKKIQLCLYYPDGKEWTKNDPLCNTIIAWIYLWLYYYEEWQYSGIWKGGGTHPSQKDESKEKKLSPLKKIRGNKKPKKKNNTLSNYINRIYKREQNKLNL